MAAARSASMYSSAVRQPAGRASVELVFSNEVARAGGPWNRFAGIAVKRVLGRDGTLRNRLPDTPLAGRGYIKTGSLDGVRSAAGYLLDANGQWQAFALMINHPRATYSDRVLEATLRQLYQGQAALAQTRVR